MGAKGKMVKNPNKWEASISIVIPAYNEAARILPSLNALSKFCNAHFRQYEIICVDDGSCDNTWKLIRGYQKIPFFKALRVLKNRGKGYAVKQGMRHATGRYCFFTDADLPYHLGAFNTAMEAFHTQGCDMVGGDRSLADASKGLRVSSARRLAGKIFSVVARRLVEMDVSDSQCGFKGFTDTAARKIFSNLQLCGYAFDVEIFALARRMHLNVGRIPVTLVKQAGSKIRLSRDPFLMMIDLVRLALRERRKKGGRQ